MNYIFLKLSFVNYQPKGVLVLPPNNLLSSNLLSSDEIATGFSVVLLGEKKFELENLKTYHTIECMYERDLCTFTSL